MAGAGAGMWADGGVVVRETAVAIGINDIANSLLYGYDYMAQVDHIVATFQTQIDRLYTAGGALRPLPPVPPPIPHSSSPRLN